MTLGQFRVFIASRLGADRDVFDFYSLGNKLKGEATQMWRLSYVVPGALLQMRKR